MSGKQDRKQQDYISTMTLASAEGSRTRCRIWVKEPPVQAGRLLRHDGRGLDLDLGAILHQGRDLDHGHRWKVASHDPAINPSDALEIAEIVLLVSQVSCHRDDMRWLGAGFGQHVDDVLQRLADLTDEIV